MPDNLLLLPLLGGFIFLHVNHYFRFHAQRVDGYRMLVESAIAGCILGFFARILVASLAPTAFGGWITSWWNVIFPWQHSGAAALALTLGPVLGFLINIFINKEKAKDLEVRRHADSLISFLHQAERSESIISITLDSRKWYVGYVAEAPNLSPTESYFRLLPVISGYRDKDTLETVKTVLYEEAISDTLLDTEEFVITFPLKDVKSANRFDIDLYETYFSGDIEGDEDGPGEPQDSALEKAEPPRDFTLKRESGRIKFEL